MAKLNLTDYEKQKIRELCEWLGFRTECTRLEAAQAIGVEPDLQFNTRIWWPAIKALWELGQAWRSEGGGATKLLIGRGSGSAHDALSLQLRADFRVRGACFHQMKRPQNTSDVH
jgi:hypothetical protein